MKTSQGFIISYNTEFTLSFGTPTYLFLLLLFETLKLFNNIYFKFRANSHSKFKCNILMCIGTTILAPASPL